MSTVRPVIIRREDGDFFLGRPTRMDRAGKTTYDPIFCSESEAQPHAQVALRRELDRTIRDRQTKQRRNRLTDNEMRMLMSFNTALKRLAAPVSQPICPEGELPLNSKEVSANL